jgi:hypothetical protein
MQLKHFSGGFSLSLMICVSLMLFGCATGPPANVQSSTCEIKKIDWEIVQQAEIMAFGCAMGRHEGEDSLIFTVGLRNADQEPARFRLTIFLPDLDKAVAHLVPTGGKPPVLAPGAEATVKIPFMKTTQMPRRIQVHVTKVRME